MNLNFALNSKMFAVIVLVLLTAIIVTLFLASMVAHIDVWHLFNFGRMAVGASQLLDKVMSCCQAKIAVRGLS